MKKSGTWRPQLELYKKQVGELHQRLAEEAKNTDRQAFENKKILEKMEALTQEKDVGYGGGVGDDEREGECQWW